MEIRLCEQDDLDAILDVFEHTIRIACRSDYSDAQIGAWVAGRNDLERWERRMAGQYFIVAEVEDRIAGFASLGENGYVDMMYVHPDFQGKGVARELFDAIELKAREQEIRELTSNVSKTARLFFEKMGFVVQKSQVVILGSVEIENYCMVKKM